MLEQRVVLVVSIAVFIEPSDAQVLEVTIADTGGCQCRVLDTIEVVDHVAAVLAAVEQTGQYEVNDSTDEQGVVASLDAVTICVLQQGLQFSHVAGQTVEGKLRDTVGFVVARELVFVSSSRVDERNLLNRDAESSDIVDNGTPRPALQLISPVGLGTTLTITAILQEESSAVRDVGRLWTERQIACRLVVGSEIATTLDEDPAMLLTVDNDIVLGVTIGVRVAHLADTGLA